MELFKVGGSCRLITFLWEDLVDRGKHSVETFLLLLAIKGI
jgi:hypothetical protein